MKTSRLKKAIGAGRSTGAVGIPDRDRAEVLFRSPWLDHDAAHVRRGLRGARPRRWIRGRCTEGRRRLVRVGNSNRGGGGRDDPGDGRAPPRRGGPDVRVYVASSWRNEQQPVLVAALRAAGHQVYDFRHPSAQGPGGAPDGGFSWSEIDQGWRTWTPSEFRGALGHAAARRGYAADTAAMRWAEAFVLLLPCGRSAHMELGWAAGRRPRQADLRAARRGVRAGVDVQDGGSDRGGPRRGRGVARRVRGRCSVSFLYRELLRPVAVVLVAMSRGGSPA